MGKKVIKILFVDPAFTDWPMPVKIMDILNRHYRVECSRRPDFLFYSCYGSDYKMYDSCVKIFYTGENVSPHFNDCDYAIGFDYLEFGDRYLRYDPEYAHIRYCIDVRKTVDRSLAGRKFCNFIYAKVTGGEEAVLRMDFCGKLAQYKRVDCPGAVLNNMKNAIEPRWGNWRQGKLDFVKNYKFTIAFENSASSGYVTEKIIHAFMSNSIPIYYGDPDICRMFNGKAFVNVRDYGSFDEVVEIVREIDNNDDLYLQMLQEPLITDSTQLEYDDRLERFLLNVVEKGNQPFFHARDYPPKERYRIKLFKY